jgi:hypothetical protein
MSLVWSFEVKHYWSALTVKVLLMYEDVVVLARMCRYLFTLPDHLVMRTIKIDVSHGKLPSVDARARHSFSAAVALLSNRHRVAFRDA